MQSHKIVSREEWLAARKEHLVKEKEFTRLRDQLSQQRRDLPWHRVDKEYIFEGPNGKQNLSELFEGRSQLVVYHFMFHPNWDEGCKSCSFWADNFNGITVHLNHRDVTLLAVSKAPLAKLEAFKKRMGWNFKWVSSFGSDFNRDYQVSFTPEEMDKGQVYYNYTMGRFPEQEAPGISVFYKNDDGNVFHTYSCYSRGLDMLNGAYHYLDLVPKGRDEKALSYSMAWLRHHDKYHD
ncbi:MAG TPA: thioredoxin family protein [Candidatus Binatia bacterium]|nr:thioredoxin family protein [Candidatus Binatia bacterium]